MRLIRLVAVLVGLAAHGRAGEMVVCGWDEVFILDVSDNAGAPRKVWSWKAADRPELPQAYRKLFATTDECKPVAGNRILITASSDGVALVDRSTAKTEFWGRCANAHSAELLPGNRIAVACSVRDAGGNRLAVFDAAVPENELFSTELTSGHGALWDPERKTLWALSGVHLRAYSLVNWESGQPQLRLEAQYPLPDRGGHELVAIARSPQLIVTTERSVWLFDRARRTFSPHPDLHAKPGVKAITMHPRTGQLAYMQAEEPNWWSDKIHFLRPERTIRLEGQRLYKVRWTQ